MTGAPVLVDTGAWLAALHPRDQYHAPAAAELRRLRADRIPLVVTTLILAELHLHLLYGLGARRAAEALGVLKADPMVEEVMVDRGLQTAAVDDWIRRFDDQAFSLTDAVSFALMRARRIPAAFAFDRHFVVAGFATLPGRGRRLREPAGPSRT